MLKFFVVFIMLLNTSIVFAETITTYSPAYTPHNFKSKLNMNRPNTQIIGYDRQNRPYHNYHRPCYNCGQFNSIPMRDLNALEKYAFKKNFKRESDIERLERLEALAFGAIQNGDILSRYKNAEQAILSRPQPNLNRSVLNNIASFFNGQATGFTPNIENSFIPGLTPYGGSGSYFPNPAFNNSRFEQYSNGIFGGGYGLSNGSFGTGSGIKILD